MKPKRNPDVVWRLEKGIHEAAWQKAKEDGEFEDLGVLTLMFKGSIHQLNLVGAEIWTRINGVNTTGKIADEIGALFGWEREETVEAVLEFLKGIADRGWISLGADGEGEPGPKWTSGR